MDGIALSPLSVQGEEASEDVHMTNADEEVDGNNTINSNVFASNDKVFARDGKSKMDKCYYPGTIKSRRLQGGSWQFKVHYHGWNSRYDQWVSESEILKDTAVNRKFLDSNKLLQQKGKEKEESVAAAAASAAAAAASVATTEGSPKGKRKRGDEDGKPGAVPGSRSGAKRRGPPSLVSLYEDYCELPLTLKTILLDESEKICRIGHNVPFTYDCPPVSLPAQLVHRLPASVSVQQVLKHYCKKKTAAIAEKQKQAATAAASSVPLAEKKPEKKKVGTVAVEVEPTVQDVEDFCSGLSTLFQSALPKFLLYPQERSQFEALAKDPKLSQKPLAEIYGCEYLLRLYVRLPVLMQSENVNNIKVVGPLLADLLVLLQKNRQACFKGGYLELKTE